MSHVANRGVDMRRINLACIMPGENIASFSDALRRLTEAATFLYDEQGRYWFSTQPTVTKLAEDKAAEIAKNPDLATVHIEQRVRR